MFPQSASNFLCTSGGIPSCPAVVSELVVLTAFSRAAMDIPSSRFPLVCVLLILTHVCGGAGTSHMTADWPKQHNVHDFQRRIRFIVISKLFRYHVWSLNFCHFFWKQVCVTSLIYRLKWSLRYSGQEFNSLSLCLRILFSQLSDMYFSVLMPIPPIGDTIYVK